MKIETSDLPSSPLGESLLILDADVKLDVFSSLRSGVGSVDSAALSVSSGSGSTEEGVVERESGVLLSWTTYSTIGMLSAGKRRERGEKVKRWESRYKQALARGSAPTIVPLLHGLVEDQLHPPVELLLVYICVNSDQNAKLFVQPFLQLRPGFVKKCDPEKVITKNKKNSKYNIYIYIFIYISHY